MLHPDIIKILNNQINYEIHSSNIYLQMSNWCRSQGYHGAAKFLKGHADEEYVHAHKIWNFMLENGVRPTLGVVPAVEITTESLKAVLEQAYEHEKFVTNTIANCVKLSQDLNDYKTFNFLQWYVDEQIEEEDLFSTVLAKFDIAGGDGLAVYHIDKEIASIH